MNNIFKTLLTSITFLIFTSAVSFSDNTIRTRHFEVFHDNVGEYYAEIAVRSAERSFTKIAETLGHVPEDIISIIITHDYEQFNKLTRGTLPDWSAAAVIPGNRIIISPLKGKKIALEHIIAHEIVHCIINDAAGDVFVPRWFHEGCAETLSGSWGIRGRLYMAWKVSRGNLLTFTDIQQIFSAGALDATLAYNQSMIAVKHLRNIHGKTILKTIIDGIKNGLDFPSSFITATGVWPSQFEREYILHLKKAYGRRSPVPLVPGTWTIILMLAIIVYSVKKYRNKRLLKQWEETEKAGNIIDFKSFPPDDY